MTPRFDWRSQLVLASDVEIVEATVFPPSIRAEIASTGEDYIIHRPGARSSAKAIDGDGARMLGAFREPRRVVDVVIATARASRTDPQRLLEACFPFLRVMVQAGWLTVAGSAAAEPLTPSLAPGARLGRWTIQACIRLIDDSEVFRASDGTRTAAVKRLRPHGVQAGLVPLVAREAEVLRRLDGANTPTILDVDIETELPWLALTWHEGVRPDQLNPAQDLMPICLAIAEAYAGIHRQGVLHGDVHPGNVLVSGAGEVRLIDFALARLPGDPTLDVIHRGAAPGYWEPEFAAAMLRGSGETALTAAGEQYAVAALIDRILVGKEAVRLGAAANDQWHAILAGDRRCFAERGRRAWPTVERVLRRATAREPERRYPDLTTLASELRAASNRAPAAVVAGPDPVAAFLQAVLPGGPVFASGVTVPPRCSVNFGAAGLAFALYRIARVRRDGDLFSVAEIWQRRAEAAREDPDAFYDVGEFRQEELGSISPYHTASGLWLARGLLARAQGNLRAVDHAIERFLASARREEVSELDLTLGQSSALLGAALLYGARPAPTLRRQGDAWLVNIWARLAAEPPVREGRTVGYLGLAHGWGGFIYGALAWARATATPPPAEVLERLGQLAELTESRGKLSRIPVVVPGHALGHGMVKCMDGWCHGQAGHVFLRLLAAQVNGDRSQLEAATRHGEAAFGGAEGFGNLCYGLAGRAYAMLALFRATGDRVWRDRALQLASRAPAGSVCDRWPNSLYKGRVGLAVLAAEVESPELAALPLFEEEGWL